MLFSYQEAKKRHGSAYMIDKAIREGSCFKLESGVYSDTGGEDELDIVQFKYPKSILTLDSAYFYHNLTDTIPDYYYLATGMHSARIADERIRQCYIAEDLLDVGVTEIDYAGSKVRTYDLERLSIETARMKGRLASDLYKEVVLSLRKRIDDMYPARIGEYLANHPFPRKDAIERIIYEEIF